MTFDEVEQLLPNGFHDARLESIAIDYLAHKAIFEIEAWSVAEKDWPEAGGLVPHIYRRVRLTLTGLLACTVDVPNSEYQNGDASELWFDVVPIQTHLPATYSWPEDPLPRGAFQRTFYFQNDVASYIRFAAAGAALQWLSDARVIQ